MYGHTRLTNHMASFQHDGIEINWFIWQMFSVVLPIPIKKGTWYLHE